MSTAVLPRQPVSYKILTLCALAVISAFGLLRTNTDLAVLLQPRNSAQQPAWVGQQPAAMAALQQQCTPRFIYSITADACYAPEHQLRIHGCGCKSYGGRSAGDPVTYALPPPTPNAAPLTAAELADEAIFVFVHVNKAGGTMVKEGLLRVLAANGWDGAGYGTFPGWQAMGSPYPRPGSGAGKMPLRRRLGRRKGEKRRNLVSPLYVQCGRAVSREEDALPVKPAVAFAEPQPPPPPPLSRHGGHCPLRAVWGAKAMGLCDHFPGRPCVYFTLLRDPVERAVSEYNYFCVQGQEGRHKWTEEWKRQGRCGASLVDYFATGVSTPVALIEHLTRGCDKECGGAAASANLQHPCLRYLLLDRLEDGFRRMRREFGPTMTLAFELSRSAADRSDTNSSDRKKLNGTGDEEDLRSGGHSSGRVNSHGYERRTMVQVHNATTMARLRELLAPDIDLYKRAVRQYEAQWEQSLVACPQRL